MSAVQIPLTAGQNQSMTCTLPVDSQNITLSFVFTWNEQGGYWFMTILDSNNNTILDGVPVITGQYPAANILRQYQYLGIGSAYLLPASSGLADNPGYADLGGNFILVWSDSSAT